MAVVSSNAQIDTDAVYDVWNDGDGRYVTRQDGAAREMSQRPAVYDEIW